MLKIGMNSICVLLVYTMFILNEFINLNLHVTMKLLKNSKSRPGVMADKGNRSTRKAEAGRIPKVYGSSAFHTQSEHLSKQKQTVSKNVPSNFKANRQPQHRN